MSYRLRTLGGVSLSGEAGVLDGSATQRRRLALLALVAAAGECGVTRDRLIGMLWPDSESSKARQVLTQWLHLIRRDLGDDELFLGTASLRLNPTRITSDVAELGLALERKELEQAAALYAGPFLDGFYLTGAPDFERWVEEERARLATRMRGVYETLSRRALAAGDNAAAVGWAERVALLDPLDSRAALAFMRALAEAGDRARAIRHARVHATLVREQLDADADPAIAAFAEQLRTMPAQQPASARPRSIQAAGATDLAVSSTNADAKVDGALHEESTADAHALPSSRGWHGSSSRVALQIISAAGIVAVLVGLAAALSGHEPADAPLRSRVMVMPFANATGDTALNVLGQVAADWIIRGVGETGVEIADDALASSQKRVMTRSGTLGAAPAGTLISGRFYLKGDSVAFQARIVDVSADRVIGVVGPVLSSRDRALDAIEVLRRQVMGSVAQLVDDRYSALASMIAVPPSYEAFREVRYGDAAGTRRRHREAAAHYERAAAFDTNYLYPVVQLARAHGNMEDCGPVDSIGRVLAPKRDRLTRYETLQLDRELQTCAGDNLAAYRSARALYELMPTSGGTTMYLARNASALNRSREVVDLLLPQGGIVDPPTRLNSLAHLTLGLHALGDYQRELQIARFARTQYPDLAEPALYEVRALAALGDVSGVRRVVTATLMMNSHSLDAAREGLPPAVVAMGAGHELAAHGHPADGRAVASELADWLERHPPPTGDPRAEQGYLLARVGAEIDDVRWNAARRTAARLAFVCGDCIGALGARALIAAHGHDVTEAHRLSDTLARVKYSYLRGQNTFARAQIAAVLGERERAVSLLRDAIAEGTRYDMYGPYRFRSFNHAIPEFAPLRSYPPFEELLRPKE